MENAELQAATDSQEYHILIHACEEAAQVEGLTCEVGVREGGSSYMIMKTLKLMGKQRPHVAIDPYGNIDYTHWETDVCSCTGYNNEMKSGALGRLYEWCKQNDYNLIFLPLEDTEFFSRFADGVPVYDQVKTLQNEYALVFFDGPHSTEAIRKEIDFFAPRMVEGGMWVFDDVGQYPHMEKLDTYICALGFVMVEAGSTKISYKKTSHTAGRPARE